MKSIVGGDVVGSSVGHGSFIDLVVRTTRGECAVKLWIYLAEWALLKDDEEIVAADMDAARFDAAKARLGELEGRMVKSVEFLNPDEVHVGFTGHYRLEVWRPESGGEPGDALIRIFVDGRHVRDVERFDAAGPPA